MQESAAASELFFRLYQTVTSHKKGFALLSGIKRWKGYGNSIGIVSAGRLYVVFVRDILEVNHEVNKEVQWKRLWQSTMWMPIIQSVLLMW